MEVKNSLAKKGNEEVKTISTYFMQDLVKKKIIEMVGNTNAQRFITSITSAVSANPKLQECDYGSIVSAALLGESLNLSPSPQLGQYYMVPFNKKVKDSYGAEKTIKVAQFQIGYKGYIQLAIRSGYYKRINVVAIKEGELKRYDPLTEEIEVSLIEDEEIREQAPTIGYYAMFEYMNGFVKNLYWSKKKMMVHADTYSQAFKKVDYEKLLEGKIAKSDMWKYSSFWYKDFDGMAFKTMLRQLISKWGIMSIEMQEAFSKDMATITENGDYEYIENDSNIEPIFIAADGQESEQEIDVPDATPANEDAPKKVTSRTANKKTTIQEEKPKTEYKAIAEEEPVEDSFDPGEIENTEENFDLFN